MRSDNNSSATFVRETLRQLDKLLLIPRGLRTLQDKDDIETLSRVVEILTGNRPTRRRGGKRRPCCLLQDREAWLLLTRHRLNHREIAERMNIARGSVSKLLCRYEQTALPA